MVTQANKPLPPKIPLLEKVFIVIGVLVSLAFIIVAIVFFLGMIVLHEVGGGDHVNQAEIDIAPLRSEIKKLGAEEVCVDGRNGFSLGESLAFYNAQYLIDDDSGLVLKMRTIIEKQGFSLADYQPTSEPQILKEVLTATKNQDSLSITVRHQSKTVTDCAAPENNRDPAKTAVIVLNLSLEARE